MVKAKAKEKVSKKGESADLVKICKDLTEKLLALLGTKATADINYNEENDSLNVDIKTDQEAGLLIGKKGETVNSLQKFLALAIRQKTGVWHRVLVNVADWREKQELRLEQIALQAAERARETGEPQNLYNLSPAERRIIHLFLAKEKDIKTESVGVGEERYLIVTAVK